MTTVDGQPVPATADRARMRRERHAKLQDRLAGQGLDGLLLLTTSAVSYATGADAPATDSARAALQRPVAVVLWGAPHPHLFTPYPEGAAPRGPGGEGS